MFFLNGKFYPIFALLFGLGMAIFLQQAEAKGKDALKLMRRRLAFLALIGLCHICFVWWGDILVIYSLLGFAALFFYKRAARTLQMWIAGMLGVVPLLYFATGLFAHTLLDRSFRFFRLSTEPDGAIHQVYQSASFGRIMQERLANFVDYGLPVFRSDLNDFFVINAYYTQIFALILMGLLLGRGKWHLESKKQVAAVDLWWKRLLLLLIGISVANYLYAPVCSYLYYPINAGIACFYILSFVKAYRRPAFARLAHYFCAPGKISMTIYLSHTLCGSLLLYGYGLGYYGVMGPGQVILAAAIFCLLIVPAANAWVGRFRFGPFEWLWRAATYGSFPPMMLPPPRTAEPLLGAGKKNR